MGLMSHRGPLLVKSAPGSSPPTSASVTSIDSLRTSIPTKTLPDFSMARLRSVCLHHRAKPVALRAYRATHVTAAAGRLPLNESHSV